MKLNALAILCSFFIAGTASANKNISISGSKAGQIYSTLVAAGAKPTNGKVSVGGTSCKVTREMIQGDPKAKPEALVITSCSIEDTPAYEAGYEVNTSTATALIKALAATGTKLGRSVKTDGRTSRSLFVQSISCERAEETQQGDPEAKPETLVTYTCSIER